MDSKKKIIFLKILIMNKTLLLLISTPIFLFSQIDDFQGFMDFTYDNDSGKVLWRLPEDEAYSEEDDVIMNSLLMWGELESTIM